MKKTLTVVILLLTLGLQIANAQQKDITKTFDNYINATKSDKLTEQLDYFHPSLFDFFPKDTFLLALEMIKLNPMVKVGNEKLISISDIFSDNNVQYALLTFNQQMTMDMSNMKEQGGADYALSLMTKELKSQYGEDNVTFNEKLFIVEINLTNYFYTILDPKFGEWKFLPKDEKSTHITEQIIPDTIRQKI